MSEHCPLQVGDAPFPAICSPPRGVALPGLRGRDSQHFSATGPAALPSHLASHFMAHLPEFHCPSAGCAHYFCIFRWKVLEWPVGRSPSPPSSRTLRRLRASDPAPPPPSPPLPPLPFPVSKSLVAHLQTARARYSLPAALLAPCPQKVFRSSWMPRITAVASSPVRAQAGKP